LRISEAGFGVPWITTALNLTAGSQTNLWAGKWRLPMMRPMIFAFAVVALVVVAAGTLRLRSPSIELSAGTAAMPSLQELHTASGVNTLTVQETEDQALVYPTVVKR
jgi:hypothetical protein